jgi:predicted MFS family arabinose efflux permease
MTTTTDETASSGRAYCLAVLTAVAALNQLDRQLMAILLEPVRREFALSDVQLGLLSGLAFAALYTTLSIPAAVWAVSHSRRNLIATAAVVWGGMTALCGAAQSFGQLLVARLGVGVGEAGGVPPSHAIISDLYPPGERATAMAIWNSGNNIGIFVAFLFGGIIAQRFGWRMAFVAAGAVTVLFALLLRLTVREPPRAAGTDPAIRSGGRVRESWQRMSQDPTMRQVWIGSVITAAVGFGALAWIPSYLARSHQLPLATIGIYLAVVVGLGGAIGGWLGGHYSDALRRRDIRWSLWLVAAVFIFSKPFSIAFYLLDNATLALTLFALPAAVGGIFVGPAVAVLHDRVRAELRPIVSAIFLMFINFIGLGLGPLLTGALSQYVFSGAGEHSLRYALVVMQLLGIWGGVHFWLAGRHLAPRTA